MVFFQEPGLEHAAFSAAIPGAGKDTTRCLNAPVGTGIPTDL